MIKILPFLPGLHAACDEEVRNNPVNTIHNPRWVVWVSQNLDIFLPKKQSQQILNFKTFTLFEILHDHSYVCFFTYISYIMLGFKCRIISYKHFQIFGII